MLFSRFETLLVAVALIVPEALRSRSKSLEPYPAVILPAGAGTIRIRHGTVPISRQYLVARRGGKWDEVNLAEFMSPIPEHYFSSIARRDFGFPEASSATPLQLEQTAATKRWMQEKLREQGFETRQIRLMKESMSIALPSGKRAHSKKSKKKTYDLD